MKIPRVDSSNVGVLLIDVQPAFIGPAFSDGGPPLEALIFLLEDGLFTTEPYPVRRCVAGTKQEQCPPHSMAYELAQRADQIPWYPEYWAPGYQPAKPFPSEFIPPSGGRPGSPLPSSSRQPVRGFRR